MKLSFKNPELKACFETGELDGAGWTDLVLDRFVWVVQLLQAAARPEDLVGMRSLSARITRIDSGILCTIPLTDGWTLNTRINVESLRIDIQEVINEP